MGGSVWVSSLFLISPSDCHVQALITCKCTKKKRCVPRKANQQHCSRWDPVPAGNRKGDEKWRAPG